MRRSGYLCLAAVLTAACLSPPTWARATPPPPVASRCLAGDQIPPAERQAVERSVAAFMGGLSAGDFGGAYDRLSDEAKAGIPREGFIGRMPALAKAAPPAGAKQTALYVIEPGSGAAGLSVPCGSAVKPAEQARLVIGDGRKREAHVVLRTPAPDHDMFYILILGETGGEWRVDVINLRTATVGGKTGDELFALAQDQRRKGNLFNTHLLYPMAASLLDRGPRMELGVASSVRAAQADFKAPPEFQSGEPYAWRLGDRPYVILAASSMAVGGKLALILNRPLDPWPGDEGADKANKALIEAFTTAYPQVRQVFGLIIVQALSPDAQTPRGGPTYGTLHAFDAEAGAPKASASPSPRTP